MKNIKELAKETGTKVYDNDTLHINFFPIGVKKIGDKITYRKPGRNIWRKSNKWDEIQDSNRDLSPQFTKDLERIRKEVKT